MLVFDCISLSWFLFFASVFEFGLCACLIPRLSHIFIYDSLRMVHIVLVKCLVSCVSHVVSHEFGDKILCYLVEMILIGSQRMDSKCCFFFLSSWF